MQSNHIVEIFVFKEQMFTLYRPVCVNWSQITPKLGQMFLCY